MSRLCLLKSRPLARSSFSSVILPSHWSKWPLFGPTAHNALPDHTAHWLLKVWLGNQIKSFSLTLKFMYSRSKALFSCLTWLPPEQIRLKCHFSISGTRSVRSSEGQPLKLQEMPLGRQRCKAIPLRPGRPDDSRTLVRKQQSWEGQVQQGPPKAGACNICCS